MRILLVSGEYPPQHGGVGDYAHEIARGLAARGVQVAVLTSLAGAEDAVRREPGVTVFSRVRRWDWSSMGVVRETTREWEADWVHIQYQTGAYGLHPAINLTPRLLRGYRPQTRSVVTFHDLRVPYLFPKAGRLREWATRELAASSDAVIATNEPDRAQLARWGAAPALIPIGSNIAAAAPPGYARAAWRAHLGVAEDQLLLCHFGFVNPSKGLDSLLRSLATLASDATWNLRLLMIGSPTGTNDVVGASFLRELQGLIVQLGLEERVLWTGYAPPETVTAHFWAADLCVLPYKEGATFQHGTLMAALAHGMPIVTTLPRQASAPPFQYALRDGENCLLVPPEDTKALAQAIRRALGSPELRQRLCAGARELARLFSWEGIVEQHLRVYRTFAR